MIKYVIKSDGRKERFNKNKLVSSLKKAGLETQHIGSIVSQVQNLPDEASTLEIFNEAMRSLKRYKRGVAARYNLKKALYALGPAGYPFEQFVAKIYDRRGYNTEVGKEIPGYCVAHEVDVIATSKREHILIECKFHNSPGIKTNVKTALYVRARFEDIEKQAQQDSKHGEHFHSITLATNTKFTIDAIQYGECAGITFLGWSYPLKENIVYFVEKYHLYPITCLTSVTKKLKTELVKNGFILCESLAKHSSKLANVIRDERKRKKIIQEAQDICSFAPKKR
ncbi:MAG TPA: ATP cone domain-containing protein [Candidatus Babeliales bacterium]|nr:ATP cone domain-containing protein [Candidatus Babeliales bacterium]